MVNSDIRLVVRVCNFCGADIDHCKHLEALERLHIADYSEIQSVMYREVEVPTCTKSPNGSGNTATIP